MVTARPLEVGGPANITLYDPEVPASEVAPAVVRLQKPQYALRRARTARQGRRHVPAWPADPSRREAHVSPPPPRSHARPGGRPRFYGARVRCGRRAFGEMVFNTSMTGYQEILTDPCTPADRRDDRPADREHGHQPPRPGVPPATSAGLRRQGAGPVYSNWRALPPPGRGAEPHNVVGHRDHRHPRAHPPPARPRRHARGVRTGCADPGHCGSRVLASPAMLGADLAREVSTPEPYAVSRRRGRAGTGWPRWTWASRPRPCGRWPSAAAGDRCSRHQRRPPRSWPPTRTGCSSPTAPATRRRPVTR